MGNLIQEVFYINDTVQNEKIDFYSSGEIKMISNYINGEQDGNCVEFSKEGTVITEFIYDDGFLKSKLEINRLNAEGNKQGYWREFHANGKLKSESNFDNGNKIGISKTYSINGKLDKIKRYYADSLNGNSEDIVLIKLYKEFHPGTVKEKLVGGYYDEMKQGMFREYDIEGNIVNGFIYRNDTIIAEGVILENGNYDGVWKTFYDNGKLKSSGTYEKGVKSGYWTFYYVDGKKEQTGKYKKNIPSGEWKWYYKNGGLKRIEYYRKGKLEGNQIEYDEAGSEISNGEFYNGLKEGPWYYKVGDFKEVGEFTLGYKTGYWIHYYDNGQVAFKGKYDEGEAKGKHYYYHKNGIRKLVGKYVVGEKHGIWKTYNDIGEIIEVLKYSRGELISINGVKVIKIEPND